MKCKFTVVGYYKDNGHRFCGEAGGGDWVEAVQNLQADPGLTIVEVFEGSLQPLTEGQYVEDLDEFPGREERECSQP